MLFVILSTFDDNTTVASHFASTTSYFATTTSYFATTTSRNWFAADGCGVTAGRGRFTAAGVAGAEPRQQSAATTVGVQAREQSAAATG